MVESAHDGANGEPVLGWWAGAGVEPGDDEDRAAARLLGPAAVRPPDVLARLIVAAGSMKSPTGVRSRAMLTVLRYTGVRASELCAMRPSDVRETDERQAEALPGLDVIEPSGAELYVRGKGERDRFVPLHPTAAQALATWARWREVYAPGARFTFCSISAPAPGKRLRRDYVWRVVQRAARRAGVEGRAHPHMFRASLAVELSRASVPVAVIRDVLGHGNLATTDAYLRRVDRSDVRQAIGVLR